MVVHEIAEKAKIYKIEDGKFAMDLFFTEEFSRVKLDKREIRKVLKTGNIYSDWETFTVKKEVIAILDVEQNGDIKHYLFKMRAPEVLSKENILQLRISQATLDDAEELTYNVDSLKLQVLALQPKSLNIIQIMYFP